MQRILVIKQTSLGDVLHASGHLRALKRNFPNAELHLMTASTSADIFQYSPYVDRLIRFDHYAIKRHGWRRPAAAYRQVRQALQAIRQQQYDLAIDLQGLGRTVLFLYACRARQKVVKGRWPGLAGFRNRNLHAIREMDEVLRVAGLEVGDTTMQLPTSPREAQVVQALLAQHNPRQKPLLIFSPYSRWPSKDWPLDRYLELATELTADYCIVFTAAPERRAVLDAGVAQCAQPSMVSLAGQLSLLEFAELVSRARLLLSGDSFPMHVAVAKGTTVFALFAPTDERKVGPNNLSNDGLSNNPSHGQHRVLRAAHCRRCKKPHCRRRCLEGLSVAEVRDELRGSGL